MKRAAEFFLLASEQMRRNRGEESADEALCKLLPASRSPWGRRSWCAEAAASVPSGVRREFVMAYHWLGHEGAEGSLILPLFQREDVSRHQQLDDRAYLALIGAVTLPHDSPARGRSWGSVLVRAPKFGERARGYHDRFSNILGSDVHAARILRDYDDPHWLNWRWLSPKAIKGLGWVLHDGRENRTSEGEARIALDYLMEHTPSMEVWTPDDIIAWAELCFDYVAAYRRKW